MAEELCARCPDRATCQKPCPRLRAVLDSPDRGRLQRNIRREKKSDVIALLEISPTLDARTDAIVQLRYRCGLRIGRIAQALKIHRVNVWRHLQEAWAQAAKKRNIPPI